MIALESRFCSTWAMRGLVADQPRQRPAAMTCAPRSAISAGEVGPDAGRAPRRARTAPALGVDPPGPRERQQVVDHPLHPPRAAGDEADHLVGLGVELALVAAREHRREGADRAQRRGEVVRGDVGEVLELGVGAPQLGGQRLLLGDARAASSRRRGARRRRGSTWRARTPNAAPYQVASRQVLEQQTPYSAVASDATATAPRGGAPARRRRATGPRHSTQEGRGGEPGERATRPAPRAAKRQRPRAVQRAQRDAVAPRRARPRAASSRGRAAGAGAGAPSGAGARRRRRGRGRGPLAGAPRGGDLAHGVGQLGQRRALLHVAVGAERQRGLAERLAEEAGEDDDARVRRALGDVRDRLEAVHARHREVADDHVGLQVGDQRQAVDGVVGLADDLRSSELGQRRAHAVAQLARVVEQEDADRAGRARASSSAVRRRR